MVYLNLGNEDLNVVTFKIPFYSG